MEYKYVSVPRNVAAALGLLSYRDQLNDGTILLNQKDIMNGDGSSLEERVELLGGRLLTQSEAVKLMNAPANDDSADEDQNKQQETGYDDDNKKTEEVENESGQ